MYGWYVAKHTRGVGVLPAMPRRNMGDCNRGHHAISSLFGVLSFGNLEYHARVYLSDLMLSLSGWNMGHYYRFNIARPGLQQSMQFWNV